MSRPGLAPASVHTVGKAAASRVVVMHGQRKLLQVLSTMQSPCSLACRLDRRDQQGNQQTDESDDHQQLDQRESPLVGAASIPARHYMLAMCVSAVREPGVPTVTRLRSIVNVCP